MSLSYIVGTSGLYRDNRGGWTGNKADARRFKTEAEALATCPIRIRGCCRAESVEDPESIESKVYVIRDADEGDDWWGYQAAHEHRTSGFSGAWSPDRRKAQRFTTPEEARKGMVCSWCLNHDDVDLKCCRIVPLVKRAKVAPPPPLPPPPPVMPLWRTSDGRQIQVAEMSDEHLRNAYAYMAGRLEIIRPEMTRRGLL